MDNSYSASRIWNRSINIALFNFQGICRRFIVIPKSMVWPTVLPNIALFTAMNKYFLLLTFRNSVETKIDKSSIYTMSRVKFFWIVCLFMFVWSWVPLFFATSFSAISILCLLTSNKTAKFLGSSSPDMVHIQI